MDTVSDINIDLFISGGVDGDATDGVQRMVNTHRLTPASTIPH